MESLSSFSLSYRLMPSENDDREAALEASLLSLCMPVSPSQPTFEGAHSSTPNMDKENKFLL